MNKLTNWGKSFFLGYLILTFYYLGAVAMIITITYPPFQEVHQNFTQHAIVLEHFLVWTLYIPGVLMVVFAIALIFSHPISLSRSAVTASAVLSMISVSAMFLYMNPLHHQWIREGFNVLQFQQSKNSIIFCQLLPAILQAALGVYFIYRYLITMQIVTRVLFIALFVLCFFPMGTIMIECHVNYALWNEVTAGEWLAYRKLLVMPVFAAVFLIPFYFPMVLLSVVAFKKRRGVSRGLVLVSLIALVYVFIVSAAYFVPDIQFELDTHYSKELLQQLIHYEIWLRTPAELVYWFVVASMFWKFQPDLHLQ